MKSGDKNSRVVLYLLGIVAVMAALTAASVPLYRIFCEATGYGGATERAAAAPTHTLERTITVHFDAAVNPALPWKFYPLQKSVTVKVGETSLASYHAVNLAHTAITGRAVYNVQPDKVGQYFTKIQCFCFSEQTLQAGQSVDMPVTFYIDPKIAEDRNLDDVQSITLSYTFFKSE
jgi:cytochrome c oxidase assembly protein subunit 11